MGLFDTDISDAVYGGLKDYFLDATYSKDTETASPASGVTTTSTTTYSCKALVDMAPTTFGPGGLWQAGDRKVIVLQGSLSLTTPKPGDRITVRSETLVIVNVDQDAAVATWVFQCRK